ncbi:MAG: MarR family transcriptional regulator [Nitrospiraceae bacterium]|nr:MarR family transcriptional regulator [Nitrospiraceae bacterium]
MNTKRERKAYADQMGLFLEHLGLPPMAGRICGWLLVCDPPLQTAAELAEALGASRGSISTMTRQLVQFSLIERVAIPGERSRGYQVRTSGFTGVLKVQYEATVEIRKMADQGLVMLKGESPRARRRLEEFRDFYAFFEREFPLLIEKWERESARARRSK